VGSRALQAKAYATGVTPSSIASTTYTLNVAAPVFDPPSGTYPGPLAVPVSLPTPTASSPVYSGAITVSATEALNAMAFATGFPNSAVATAAYTINLATPAVTFASGFTSTTLSLINGATIKSGALQWTDGGQTEVRDAWFTTPVNVPAFTTDFAFQATSATADGFTFAIQKSAGGINALDNGGAELGYGGIGSSVVITFDLYSNAGKGPTRPASIPMALRRPYRVST
jgi:hypothetical protein